MNNTTNSTSEKTNTSSVPKPRTRKTYYYLHDHNKNVVGMIDREGNRVATYEYGPYGEITHQSGPLAEENPIRYSSEFYNSDTGLVEYLYRLYNPKDGRWLQRDPIAERGGNNLYGFVKNSPLSLFDYLGENSITKYNKNNIRVDVELNNGANSSNLHVHINTDKGNDSKNKYTYHTGKDGKNPAGFYNESGEKLPKDTMKKIRKNPDGELAKAIKKGTQQVNEKGGVAPKYGGGKISGAISIAIFFTGVGDYCVKYIEAFERGESNEMDNIYFEALDNIPDFGTITSAAMLSETEGIHNEIMRESRVNKRD